MWDAKTGKELLTLAGHTSVVTAVASSADGKRIASAGVNDGVKVWDTQTGQEALWLEKETASLVSGLSLSADGRYVVERGANRAVQMWETEAPPRR